LVMTLNSGVSVIGFVAGPAFAWALSFVKFHIYEVQINSNTAPGYCAAIFSLLGILILMFLKEIPRSQKTKRPTDIGSGASGFYSGQGSTKSVFGLSKLKGVPWLPVVLLNFAVFAFTAAFTTLETIGTPYTEHEYQWTVRQNGEFFACLGVTVIVSLAILQIFLKFFNDRICLIGSTCLMIAGLMMAVNFDNLGYVSMYRMVFGAGLGSVGFSPACALAAGIYSKLLENFDQGALMGLAQSSASISRVIGPLAASYTLQYTGPSTVFIEMSGLLFVALILIILGYKTMLPVAYNELRNVN